MSSGLRVSAVAVGELREFAARQLAEWTPGQVVPMSLRRAQAWEKNPHAVPDDVALLVAWYQGQCIGYIGLLPALARAAEREETVSWLSTWYVPPPARNLGAGAMLLLRALALRRTLLASGIAQHAADVCRGVGFRTWGPLQYWCADLRSFNLAALALRGGRKVARLLGKRESNRWNDRVEEAARQPSPRMFKAMIWSRLGREWGNAERWKPASLGAWIGTPSDWERTATGRPFVRSLATLEWMFAEPWVVTPPAQATPGYHFDDYRPFFEYRVLELPGQRLGEVDGYAVVRGDEWRGCRTAQVLDYGLRSAGTLSDLVALAVAYARQIQADRLQIPWECGAELTARGWARRLFAVGERPYLCRPGSRDSVLAGPPADLQLSLADGDVPFA